MRGNNSAPSFECGPGPATPGRITRVSLTCHGHRGGGAMKASTDSAGPSKCRARGAWFEAHLHAMAAPNLTVASSFSLLRRAEGEEAASPGNQSRKRVSGSFPPAIHFRESPVPLVLPQSFGPARNFHVSLDTLSVTSGRAATPKTGGTVKKLWTMRLPCGSPRKSPTRSGTTAINL